MSGRFPAVLIAMKMMCVAQHCTTSWIRICFSTLFCTLLPVDIVFVSIYVCFSVSF